MSPRTRTIVLFATVPVLAFALVGGLLGNATAREDAYRHLRVFEDVVSLIANNYVEDVELDTVMVGALRGMAGSLDADSSFLPVEEVERIESGTPLPEGELGVEVISQVYLQIVGLRDGSPAARAGLLPGDYIRAIDGEPTRLMSALEGQRVLHGTPGSTIQLSLLRGNTAEPYDIELTREQLDVATVSSRPLTNEDAVYIRIPAFLRGTAADLQSAVETALGQGASRLLIDVRNTAGGVFEEGIAAARLFVPSGTLLRRAEHDRQEVGIEATAGPAAIDAPLVILTDNGTAHAAELFVAALTGAERATAVGQRTAGRASLQRLIKLPDGTGLWLSWARYVFANGDPIHRIGVVPDVAVDVPVVELGEPSLRSDPIYDAGVEQLRALVS